MDENKLLRALQSRKLPFYLCVSAARATFCGHVIHVVLVSSQE